MRAIVSAIAALFAQAPLLPAHAQVLELDETCIVTILNRAVQVDANGRFALPNVPANQGRIRARATCVRNGVTVSGQSDYFVATANEIVNVGEIFTGSLEPIPVRLEFTHTSNDPQAPPGSPNVLLTAVGQQFPLGVSAIFSDGTDAVITASPGTNYSSSNANFVSVDNAGVVTAVASGVALITVRKDGVVSLAQVRVVTTGDSDGDGLPDDFEVANGLNPNDPVDAFEDQDRDGLSALEEFGLGTAVNSADSDGDGIEDGEEVVAGADGFVTNPLAADTDGDGVGDSLELFAGTDPTDPDDVDFTPLLVEIIATPSEVDTSFDAVAGEGSFPIAVEGRLINGSTVDLTDTSRGTSYASSDFAVCNFGSEAGTVFVTNPGACTVTVTNGSFLDTVAVTVDRFDPVKLSTLELSVVANNVDADPVNPRVYVATQSGLRVVDTTNPSAPVVMGSFGTLAYTDVKVVGNRVYLAAGATGVQIVNVTNPASPALLGTFNSAGSANDLVVSGNLAFVADGTNGLVVIDVSNPASPTLVASLALAGSSGGVALNATGTLAAVASGTGGLQLVNVSNPASPTLVGSVPGGDVRDVAFRDGYVLLADASRSFTAVDVTNPASPMLGASTARENGGLLNDVATQGDLAFGADIFFVNGVPIINVVDPLNPAPRVILDFSGQFDDNGNGIAVDNQYAYLAANTRLYIGHYRCGDQDADELCLDDEAEAGTDPLNPDTDGDALLDGFEVRYGLNPLVPNNTSLDADNDGLSLLEEQAADTHPFDSDTDNDGLNDGDEVEVHGSDPNSNDTDADGILDAEEVVPGTDGYVTNPANPDTDGDGASDSFEVSLFTNPTVFDDFANATIVVNNRTLVLNQPLNAGGLQITNGGVVTHPPTSNTAVRRLEIHVGTLTIDATSAIDVSGRGFLGGRQPGNANSDSGRTIGNPSAAGSSGASGGSYGGLGGDIGNPHDNVYGDFTNPNHPGSGGGGSTGFGCTTCFGGNGGGLVRIAADTVTLNGRISANGGAGTGGSLTGSGAGGGIFLDAGTLSGSGRIEADGGNNTTGSAGGGGRVAVLYESASGFSFANITAKPGNPTGADPLLDAGAGTVFLRDKSDQDDGTLVVDSRGFSPTGQTPLRSIGPRTSNALTANSLTVTGASFPVPSASSGAAGLVGLEINPNTAQSQTFTVVGNTATTLTTDPADGDMTAVAAVGNPAIGVYFLDDLQVLGGANVTTTDEIVVAEASSFTVDGTLKATRLQLDQTTALSIPGALEVNRLDAPQLANLTVDTGTLILRDPLTTPALNLTNGSTLTQIPTTSSVVGRVDLQVDTLTIDATSAIDVTGRGFLGGRQPGNAASDSGRTIGNAAGSSGASGGSYGGLGGDIGNPHDNVYGDFTNPNHPGSGGGGSTGFGCTTCFGGNGGGLVRIAADTVTLNGRISANGGVSTGGSLTGSGAGGGIFLDAGTLSGSGRIEADGGNNTTGSAGGGGRVAVLYENAAGFSFANVTAKPGNPTGTATALDAGAGTVFLRDKLAQDHGTLIVDSRGISPAGPATPLRAIGARTSSALTANSLTVTGASFPVPSASSGAAGLIGLELNPNTAQSQTFTVVGNTATSLSTDPADGDMTAVAATGNPAIGVYFLDELTVRGQAHATTADRIDPATVVSVEAGSSLTSANLTLP